MSEVRLSSRLVAVGLGMLCALWFVIYATGCGYRPTCYIKDATTIALPIFENNSTWRGCEFDLTNRVRGEIIIRTPLRLTKASETADLVLSGEIVDYTRPVQVEDDMDRVIQSKVSLTLKVLVKDQRTDKVVYKGSQTAAAEFVTSRGENETAARYEVYEKLARWVVSRLEAPAE